MTPASFAPFSSVLLATALCFSSGCLFPDFFDVGDDDYSGYGNELETSNPSLQGELGEREFVGERARVTESYSFTNQTSIEIHVSNRRGAAMNVLNLNVSVEDIEVGDIYENNVDDYDTDVDILGCAGPSEGNWDFDSYADQATVTVHEGSTPDSVVLVYEARWDAEFGDPSSEIQGSVEVNRGTTR